MGEKGKTQGEIGKILASEASLVVVWEGLPLALPVEFFFRRPRRFSQFSLNAEPGPKLRGWLYQGSTAFGVSMLTENDVYTMVPIVSVTIAY